MFEPGQEVWFVYEICSSVTTPPDQCLMVYPGRIVGIVGFLEVRAIGMEDWKYEIQITEDSFLKDCRYVRSPNDVFSSRKAAEKALKLREQELLKERKAAFVELGKMLRQYKERRYGK